MFGGEMFAASPRAVFRPLAALFLIAFVAPMLPPVHAQAPAVSGRVTDVNGAALPGATVTLRDPDTGQERSVTTDADGQFSMRTPADSPLLNLLVDSPG